MKQILLLLLYLFSKKPKDQSPKLFGHGSSKKKIQIFDETRNILYFNFIKYRISKHIYYYLAPNRTKWEKWDGQVHIPTYFGIAKHNAKVNCGILPPMSELLKDLDLLETPKTNKGIAENFLEEVRKEYYPNKPSRFRCYYLNYTKEIAEARKLKWNSFSQRDVIRCKIFSPKKSIHIADVRIFEHLCYNPGDIQIAKSYWETFYPKNSNEWQHAEILSSAGLYCLDWQTFEFLNFESIANYQTQLNTIKNIAK